MTRRAVTCGVALASTAVILAGLAGQEAFATGDADAHPLAPRATRVLSGQSAGALGAAMAPGACDVAGDAKPDVLASDWWWSRGEASMIGAAYVAQWEHLAPATKPTPIDDEDRGVRRVEGTRQGEGMFGFTLDCAGDVNGDGKDDIIVADYMNNRALVAFGAKDFSSTSTDYLGDRGYFIAGSEKGRTGTWVRGLGDVDGDGLADTGILETAAADGRGRVSIVAGADDVATVDLNSSSDRVIATVSGAKGAPITQLAPVGDVNGDGIADYAATSYAGTTSAAGEGAKANGSVWILFGSREPVSVDVSQPLGERGFQIHGPARGRDRLGMSVVAAGDINGDGYGDVLVGADSLAGAGGAVVIFGSADHRDLYTSFTDPAKAVVDDAGKPRGVVVLSGEERNGAGYSVAAIEPKEGRAGLLVIGAYNASIDGKDSAGEVTLVSTAGLPDHGIYRLDEAPADEVARIRGTFAGQRLGRSVSAPGDVNGDGHPDVAWGADAVRAGTSSVTLGLMGELPRLNDTPSPSPTSGEEPGATPSEKPSKEPGAAPSVTPSEEPSEKPSKEPGATPGGDPSEKPSEEPSEKPSKEPGATPGGDPSSQPVQSPQAAPKSPAPTPASTLATTGVAASLVVMTSVALLGSGLILRRKQL